MKWKKNRWVKITHETELKIGDVVKYESSELPPSYGRLIDIENIRNINTRKLWCNSWVENIEDIDNPKFFGPVSRGFMFDVDDTTTNIYNTILYVQR